MAENAPPLSTDEIIQVFEHLSENENATPGTCIAGHGLDPVKAKRAIEIWFPEGNGRHNAALAGFVFGLQFGAMRLPPFEGYEEKPCECLVCVARRAAEAQAGGDSPPDAEES